MTQIKIFQGYMQAIEEQVNHFLLTYMIVPTKTQVVPIGTDGELVFIVEYKS
jgi:hypothetical protein